jgi:hypothetical protein
MPISALLYLPIREATASSKTSESIQREAIEDVRHMDINSVKASGSESECHFGVAIDTLLSENSNYTLLALTHLHSKSGNLTSGLEDQALEAGKGWEADIGSIELELVVQTGVLAVLDGIILRLSTVGVVSELLHLVGSACPPLLDLDTVQIGDSL